MVGKWLVIVNHGWWCLLWFSRVSSNNANVTSDDLYIDVSRANINNKSWTSHQQGVHRFDSSPHASWCSHIYVANGWFTYWSDSFWSDRGFHWWWINPCKVNQRSTKTANSVRSHFWIVCWSTVWIHFGRCWWTTSINWNLWQLPEGHQAESERDVWISTDMISLNSYWYWMTKIVQTCSYYVPCISEFGSLTARHVPGCAGWTGRLPGPDWGDGGQGIPGVSNHLQSKHHEIWTERISK